MWDFRQVIKIPFSAQPFLLTMCGRSMVCKLACSSQAHVILSYLLWAFRHQPVTDKGLMTLLAFLLKPLYEKLVLKRSFLRCFINIIKLTCPIVATHYLVCVIEPARVPSVTRAAAHAYFSLDDPRRNPTLTLRKRRQSSCSRISRYPQHRGMPPVLVLVCIVGRQVSYCCARQVWRGDFGKENTYHCGRVLHQ